MKSYLFLIFTFLSLFSQAQLLDNQFTNTDLGDTLRGALRPERTCFDVNYYDLNLYLDFEEKTINGFNQIHFTAVEDFDRLQIDLFENMLIDSIVYKNESLSYSRIYDAVFVDFFTTIQKGEKEFFTVYYHGQPIIANNPPWDGGFSWKKDKNGNPWLGVSCEGIGASLWWPNKDHLSDEPDSMQVMCNIPADLTFVGNGQLVFDNHYGERRETAWKVTYPINNYNVTLNVGKYINFTDNYTAFDGEELLLDYWVMPYNLEKAKTQFKQVQPMLSCYEGFFGKFPFWNDNFKLVETSYLGMEHQTAIAYGNEYKKGYNGYDFSRIGLDFDYIIIHETGHEYWGNLISCEDMADLWIHEGFCTYSEALYVECMFDYQKGQDYVNAKKPSIGNKHPMAGIYDLNIEGDGDMYNKGMLFLNTLRHVVNNDELWFKTLKDMNSEFAYQTINANDVMFYFNRKTGMDLTPLFLQYVFEKDIPVLYYKVEKEKGKKYTLKYRWATNTGGFEMPIEVKVGKNKTIRLNATNNLQVYDFTKKKKEGVKFNQEQFYIEVKKY